MQGKYDTFAEVPKASVDKAISSPWAEDGRDFSDRIWQHKTQLKNTIQAEITRMLIAREGTTLLSARIAKRMNVSFENARRLAETETAYVQETARMNTWQKLGVGKYELVAVLDNRTSPICQKMDGKIFDRADAKPGVTMPPFHCYCRTTSVPYIPDAIDEKDTRVAIDPETGKTVSVPAGMKYNDWKAVYVDKSVTLDEWKANNEEASEEHHEYYGIKSFVQKAVNNIKRKYTEPANLRKIPRIKGKLTLEENVRRTNPNFSKHRAYQANCQKCIPTLELRMRGYDVEAKWFNEYNANSEEKWLAHHPFSAFYDAEIVPVPSNNYQEVGIQLNKAIEQFGNGARFEISIYNLDYESGHVILGYNIDGRIKYIDVQRGMPFSFSNKDGRIKVEYARIDNLNINDELLNDICKWGGGR